MEKQFWLIWSDEHDGWWCPEESGYTTDIRGAGVYTYLQAVKICYGANFEFRISTLDLNKRFISRPNEAMVPITEGLANHIKKNQTKT